MTDDTDRPDLPPGWRWASPTEIAANEPYSLAIGPFGSNLKVSDYREGGVPLVFVRNIRSGVYDGDDSRYVSSEKAEELSAHRVAPGDVLITKMGAPPGDADIYPKGRPPAIITADCIKLRTGATALPEFVCHMTNAPTMAAQIAQITSGVAQQKVSLKRFKTLSYPLPPLDEQRRIVDAIESVFADLDAGVAALAEARAGLDRYRQSMLKAAVEGALTADWRAAHPDAEPASALLARAADERRAQWEADQLARYEVKGQTPSKNWQARYKPPAEPETEDLPDAPDGWAWASVDQLAALEDRAITDGPFGSNLKTAHYTESGPRVIRLQNIGDGEFVDVHAHVSQDHFDTLDKHHIEGGDLVIASLGEELPRACIVPASVGPALVKADCVRFKPNADVVLPTYALFSLNAPPTRERTTGSIHGVGRPRINLGKLRTVALPVPPLAEQVAIVEAVEERLSVTDAVAAEIDRQLARAERLRRSVLHRAFTGKLVPQVPVEAAPADGDHQRGGVQRVLDL